ncbi:DNA ligase (ATP) [Exophiala xenobiotica]|nr:DNA ligase (ATP) [Exophiala xenobiotica]KAK5288903.1 DNA ligase (ATP) [Exophiala xenobiotica]KAK5314377.1 DNA ligase (ATP) [Exophiala xenobiotica]KAK5361535.1 DNA ligase (ATP) [Exophiala xenobiotica]KAK5368473.1 DNA ligase (ATP) [Exophiala xenobiotica]
MATIHDEEMDVDSGNKGQTDQADIERQLDEEYPNRPHNKHRALPFHTLIRDLFEPLIENRNKKAGPAAVNRRKVGPNAGLSTSPSERRRALIERYISRWRRDVGPDFFPAFRLIIPDKDRERGVYGLKEKILGKLLVKILKIDKNSDDGFNLMNWKIPGGTNAPRSSGDFALRCYEVISKRQMRTEYGDMDVDEVNQLLDKLSAAPREETQLPILTEFYKRMNADELTWLIRIILRSMKVGATEKTFFHIWHPDAENLFNISSNLRRVCWELWDPEKRLDSEETGVSLMQCFQPQLAQYTQDSLKRIVQKVQSSPEDQEFWIEEKLDGERMQLHMVVDNTLVGGRRFQFWSRKGKDYTYLYGNGLYDEKGALTQFLKNCFHEGVNNIILDGEMITWDPKEGAPVAFGTLKSAAIAEQRNPFAGGQRPLFRVFDVLLLNDKLLTRYTLAERRKALEASINPEPGRLEIHPYKVATGVEEVETALREVIAEASEGLVLKNPRGAYKLDDRNGDWQKVKPEYMTGYGESLDCLIIGGFYGSGRRGGNLSSFLCGLRLSGSVQSQSQHHSQSQSQTQSQTQSQSQASEPFQKFTSFFKVGGGMTANDYATIRHETDGKWHKWDARRPPTKYIDLGGGPQGQREKPDMWIKPEDSLVVQAKAAQVVPSEDYGCGMTLRFPRFQKIRRDKNWQSALSLDEFQDLRKTIEDSLKRKALEIDEQKKQKRRATTRKKVITVAGYNAKDVNNVSLPAGPQGNVFEGLTFYIMTEAVLPSQKKSKLELEALVKANGGKIVQTHNVVKDTICVAARRTVKVASLEKTGEKEIIKPTWIFDCIDQARHDFAVGYLEMVVPVEPERHLFFAPEGMKDRWTENLDDYGDSFARDTSVDELREIMENMRDIVSDDVEAESRVPELFPEYLDMKGFIFLGLVMLFDNPAEPEQTGLSASPTESSIDSTDTTTRNFALFGGARVLPYSGLDSLPDNEKFKITHIIAHSDSDLQSLRRNVSRWTSRRIPRILSPEWIQMCWKEGTKVDEEAYVAR